jgi:hypothetical protein
MEDEMLSPLRDSWHIFGKSLLGPIIPSTLLLLEVDSANTYGT